MNVNTDNTKKETNENTVESKKLKFFDTTIYYKSISGELSAIKSRVRDLIQDTNWGEDGFHKERIIRSLLSRVIPQKYKIGTGFFVYNYENRRISKTNDLIASPQLDIIIYDTSHSMLYLDSDFVIVPVEAVRAIIEVKTNLHNTKTLKEAIVSIHKSSLLLSNAGITKENFPFIGVFGFEPYDHNDPNSISSEISNNLKKAYVKTMTIDANQRFMFGKYAIFRFPELCHFICFDSNYLLAPDEIDYNLANIRTKTERRNHFPRRLLSTII